VYRTGTDSGWLVLYDGECAFCRASLGLLLRWDRRGRLEPVALQSARAADVLAELGEEERMGSWHLVSPGGERWSAGAAAPPLLRLLPGGRPVAGMLAAAPRLTERTYRFVADHRGAFGRILRVGGGR
jgi:predicted DCC family thiol-disulfide oxidoreductase YuxK